LINVYKVVRDDVEDLIKELKKHKNESDYYYHVRELDRTEGYKEFSDARKAARVIYLNKTCYNGLFRVNAKVSLMYPLGVIKILKS
jgi:DNA adenine methylase